MSIWSLLDPWIPQLHVWWIDPRLKLVAPTSDEIADLAAALSADPDPSRAAGAAEAVAAAENSRIDRLEAKLDGQRTVITAISPFTVLVAAWALDVTHVAALILAAIAIGYLLSAYLIAMRGGASRERLILGGSAY